MIRCCALYYIDADTLVTDHDSVLTFVKVLLTFAVYETKIALSPALMSFFSKNLSSFTGRVILL